MDLLYTISIQVEFGLKSSKLNNSLAVQFKTSQLVAHCTYMQHVQSVHYISFLAAKYNLPRLSLPKHVIKDICGTVLL